MIGFHVRLNYTNDWISCKIGLPRQMIGFHVRFDYTNDRISCEIELHK
jgi:hypothetical protein